MLGSRVSELQTFKMHALVIDVVIPDLYGLKITYPPSSSLVNNLLHSRGVARFNYVPVKY